MFASLRRFQATPAYGALLSSLKVDLKKAMIAKNNMEKTTIRSILSTIKNNEIDGGAQTEFELSKVLGKMVKQRVDSAREFQQQKRDDLAEIESKESEIIKKYVESLPVASDEEIKEKLTHFLNEIKANDANTHVGAIFKQINDDLASSWGAAPSVIKSMVPSLYKDIFKK
ncbi:hypothetical protein CLUG_01095 [Clavispora lusitaniae ATCC 42720]|uniref:Altered inheritance of mitochondria protein 41, mitochondrial n=2 Tax=Clavispora lusitaniae TaxID=36911 RepID=AIM41_CLAL4|nr:uncharacterized protein CLUG_01095 [Clavispora lusitaniae ATCC 42720]C4XYS2.1 RecName: Full=Altered inheritance of mitochondria protein 41, mitochondrial; Flags: Precursor [Clavispora lusitaniae ATCC 42720]EEQ36972.1 hypothetical protein CLUG_01095 [Clavispora lusitaniae ATCC 42720]OVF08217.1 hypothetical protein A9F13_09g01496 [Clavispora lusitaniae]